jgi:hypothetical protein
MQELSGPMGLLVLSRHLPGRGSHQLRDCVSGVILDELRNESQVSHVLQNDFKIRAAFSHSLSSAVGQYASLEELDGSGAGLEVVVVALLSRLADKLARSPTHPKTLSSDTRDGLGFDDVLVLLFVLVAAVFDLSHDGSSAETRCIVLGSRCDPGFSSSALQVELCQVNE